MKFVLGLFIFAILATSPLMIIGKYYFDGVFAADTYDKSIRYDATRATLENADIFWLKPECSADDCRFSVSVSPAPDNNSVNVLVFQPAGGRDLIKEVYNEDGRWYGVFTRQNSGWYVLKIEYTVDGHVVGTEKSFYI